MGRNPFYVNGEGYADSTAGMAIQNIQRGKEGCYGKEEKLQAHH